VPGHGPALDLLGAEQSASLRRLAAQVGAAHRIAQRDLRSSSGGGSEALCDLFAKGDAYLQAIGKLLLPRGAPVPADDLHRARPEVRHIAGLLAALAAPGSAAPVMPPARSPSSPGAATPERPAKKVRFSEKIVKRSFTATGSLSRKVRRGASSSSTATSSSGLSATELAPQGTTTLLHPRRARDRRRRAAYVYRQLWYRCHFPADDGLPLVQIHSAEQTPMDDDDSSSLGIDGASEAFSAECVASEASDGPELQEVDEMSELDGSPGPPSSSRPSAPTVTLPTETDRMQDDTIDVKLNHDQMVWLQRVVSSMNPLTFTIKNLKRRFAADFGPISPALEVQMMEEARRIHMCG